MSNLRRSMMAAGRGGGDYPDWQFGVKCTINSTEADAISATSPMIPVSFTGTPWVVWYNYFSENNAAIKTYYLQFFDAEKEFIVSINSNNSSLYNYNARRYKLTAAMTGASYVRLCVKADMIDDAYLYDEDAQRYVWKGKNIT